jgi:DNA-binding transcriptional regulator YbjK
MRPANERRRAELADAAIEVAVREGLHGLSHRAVDEAAGVPRGTVSNYFRSRDALLEATQRRLMDLHFDLMKQFRARSDGLVDSVSGVLEHALTQYPGRYLVMLELALGSTRDPDMRRAFVGLTGEAMERTYQAHDADWDVSAKDVQLLSVFYNGLLFTSLVMPEILADRSPGELTREALEKLLSISGEKP